MINKKYLKNLRCKEINNKNDFIFDLHSERIIDSLDIIKLEFKNILIFGNYGCKIHKYIKRRYKDSLITICDFKEANLNNFNSNKTKRVCTDLDLWIEEPLKYDLILSNLLLSITVE